MKRKESGNRGRNRALEWPRLFDFQIKKVFLEAGRISSCGAAGD
jgi:hypothetical protein